MTTTTTTMAATGVYQASSAAQITPAQGSAFETTFFGATISGMITDTAHVWTADANGLFTTTADLATEWQNAYSAMMEGDASTLTFIQRLEGNAQAVIQNTGLAKLDATTQARDRMDAQREFDAIGVAMNQLGTESPGGADHAKLSGDREHYHRRSQPRGTGLPGTWAQRSVGAEI